MTRDIPAPTFRLKNLELSNLDSFSIEDVSAGRGFGRRFHVKCGDGETGDLVLKRVFAKLASISKKATSIDDLKKVKDALVELRTVEEASIAGYGETETMYRFRTWFHRIFTFGSHLEKIDTLLADVTVRYETSFAKADMIPLHKVCRSVHPESNMEFSHNGEDYTIFLSSNSLKIRQNSTYQSLTCNFFNGEVISMMVGWGEVIDAIPEQWQGPLRAAFDQAKIAEKDAAGRFRKADIIPLYTLCRSAYPEGEMEFSFEGEGEDYQVRFADNSLTITNPNLGQLTCFFAGNKLSMRTAEGKTVDPIPEEWQLALLEVSEQAKLVENAKRETLAEVERKKAELGTLYYICRSSCPDNTIEVSCENERYQVRALPNQLTIKGAGDRQLICSFANDTVSMRTAEGEAVDSIPEEWQAPLSMALKEAQVLEAEIMRLAEEARMLVDFYKAHEGLGDIAVSHNNENYRVGTEPNRLTIKGSGDKQFSCSYRAGRIDALRTADEGEERVVDTIPEEWRVPLQMAFAELKKNLCEYEDYGFEIIKSSLSEFPDYHLNQWCQKVIIQGADNKSFRITYKSDDNTNQRGSDAGGLRRDYFSSLVEGLVNETLLFGTLDSSLKVPRMEKDQPLTHAEKIVYQDLGSLMWYSFNSRPTSGGSYDRDSVATGMHFDDALFRGVLALNPEEIQTPFENLSLPSRIKMVNAILEKWQDDTKSDLENCNKCLDLLDKEKMKACIESDNERPLITALCAVGLDIDYIDEESFSINRDKMKDMNLDAFMNQFETALFNSKTLVPQLKGASLGSILAPIHSTAKGMFDAAGASQWNDRMVGIGVSALSQKIQGSIDRDKVVSALELSGYWQSQGMKTKLQWLQDWIKADTTTDQEIKQFVKFCTGMDSLPSGIKIKIEGGRDGAMPVACTCGYGLTMSSTVGEAYHDGTYEKFVDKIRLAIATEGMDLM